MAAGRARARGRAGSEPAGRRRGRRLTRWRYDAANTGVNPSETRLSPGSVRGLRRTWFLDQCCVGTPLVAGGTLYVGGTENVVEGPGQIHALDAATGRPRWAGLVEFTGDESAVTAPVIANGVVYATTVDNRVYAFNSAGCSAATCRPLWSDEINPNTYSTASRPLSVSGGAVYTAATRPASAGGPCRPPAVRRGRRRAGGGRCARRRGA